jgi:hypothetical protein
MQRVEAAAMMLSSQEINEAKMCCHAFYIQHSEDVGRKSLDTHVDNSHWTINLLFDPQNIKCVPPTLPSSKTCNNSQMHSAQSWSRHYLLRCHATPRAAAALRQPRQHHRLGQAVAPLLTLRERLFIDDS